MATPGLHPDKIARGRQMYRDGVRTRKIADELGIGIGSLNSYLTDGDKEARQESLRNGHGKEEKTKPVKMRRAVNPKTATMPTAKHEVFDSPDMPDAIAQTYEPYAITTPGHWGIISDIHLPYHDRLTLELFVAECKRRKVAGILLNGDILDSHEVSDHDKEPGAMRYVDEIEKGKQLLAWFRGQFQDAEIVYRLGNHEERLERYIIRRAPALFGVEGLTVQSLLHLEQLGIEYVGDRRIIELGKLNVIHGHEYRGGVSSPVNPARGLYLKARSVALAGHHHQTSEHHAKDIRDRAEAAWSTGCACFLSPMYLRKNNWNHGFAFCELDSDGDFIVENKRILGGKIV